MKTILRRLSRLENYRRGSERGEGPTVASVLRERRCRRLAQERGLPYEQVLRESIIQSQSLVENYAGTGKIADIIRYARSQGHARNNE